MSVVLGGTNSRGVAAYHADLNLPDAGSAGDPSGGWGIGFIANFGSPQDHREHVFKIGDWPNNFIEVRIFGSAEGNANLMAFQIYADGGDLDSTIYWPAEVRDGTLHRYRIEMSAAGVLQVWQDGVSGDNVNLSAGYSGVAFDSGTTLRVGTGDSSPSAASHVTAPEFCEFMILPRPFTIAERTAFDSGTDGDDPDWPGHAALCWYKLIDATSPCPNSGSGGVGTLTLTDVTSFGSHPITYAPSSTPAALAAIRHIISSLGGF